MRAVAVVVALAAKYFTLRWYIQQIYDIINFNYPLPGEGRCRPLSKDGRIVRIKKMAITKKETRDYSRVCTHRRRDTGSPEVQVAILTRESVN
jgi:hypothetical protein